MILFCTTPSNFIYISFSVLVQTRNAYTVGQPITFHLMKREKGSLIASPVLEFDVRHGQRTHLLSVSENELDTNFSKLLAANSAEVSLNVIFIIERF